MKVVSYNICAIPALFNVYKNPIYTIDGIIKILKLIDADVICLQEVFDPIISQKILKTFQNYNILETQSTFFLNSGLIILTKYNIIDFGFEKYNSSAGEDSLSNKGLLFFSFYYNNIKINIINTHIQALAIFSKTNTSQTVQLKQFKQLLSFSKKFNNVLICGDLNMVLNTILFNIILQYHNNIITNKQHKLYYTDRLLQKQFDYILFLTTYPTKFNYNYSIYKTDLSDHYPIILTIS